MKKDYHTASSPERTVPSHGLTASVCSYADWNIPDAADRIYCGPEERAKWAKVVENSGARID
jgi:hypothetical protein